MTLDQLRASRKELHNIKIHNTILCISQMLVELEPNLFMSPNSSLFNSWVCEFRHNLFWYKMFFYWKIYLVFGLYEKSMTTDNGMQPPKAIKNSCRATFDKYRWRPVTNRRFQQTLAADDNFQLALAVDFGDLQRPTINSDELRLQ